MPLSNRIDTTGIRRGVPMTGLEFDKLLNEALAELGLSVKAVTKSSYMPDTGVIMTPRGMGRAGRVSTTTEVRRLINPSNPSKATQDLLNGYWQRDTIDDENLRREEGVDMDGKESIEEGECHVLS
ncbi:hypothetical protein M1N56_06475 [Dehalococcoidia bacterium]|nr:hypothetical protein [Dehalococcoidia bacterium]